MKTQNFSLYKDSVFDKCPECKTVGTLRRSRGRNFFENMIKNSGFLNYYRCRECGWRGLRSNFSLKKLSWKMVFYYIIMIILTAYIVKFIVVRFVMK